MTLEHKLGLVTAAGLGLAVLLLVGAAAAFDRWTAPEIERVLPADARLESSGTEWEEPLLSFDDGADHRLEATMSRESFSAYARRLEMECEPTEDAISCSRVHHVGRRYPLPVDLLVGEAPQSCGMDCEVSFVAARWSHGRARVRQFHSSIYY